MISSSVNEEKIRSEAVSEEGFSISPLLKVAEYLCLSVFVGLVVVMVLVTQNTTLFTYAAISFTGFFFFSLVDKQLGQNEKVRAKKALVAKQAAIYTCLLEDSQSSLNSSIVAARERALQYSQELIDDYKKLRSDSRNIYYLSQFLTIVLSGLTPILVLLDKLDLSIAWIKWLPVIFPAIASIVASAVTSFPFQENAIKANTAVELLEAEQEKFVLGVTALYRSFDIVDEAQRQQQSKQAIENYINQVNEIHLKQVQESSKSGNKPQETASSSTSSSSSSQA